MTDGLHAPTDGLHAPTHDLHAPTDGLHAPTHGHMPLSESLMGTTSELLPNAAQPRVAAGRHPSTDRDLLVGVDVGGSTIAVLIADDELTVAGRFAAPTRRGQPELAAHQVVEAVRAACHEAGVDLSRLAAVGVGVPGRVDEADGTVSLALNLGWLAVPLGRDLERVLGVPCFVANDVRAAAGGLVERHVVGDVEDLIYISVGTGIAAGIVLGGRVQYGAHGMAGEVGHLVVEPGGAACVCGLQGCLETVATGPAIAARAIAAIRDGGASSLAGRSSITGADVYTAAAQGDALAAAIVDHAGIQLARVIYHLALMVDVDRICLGGGVAHAGATFMDPIQRELSRLREASSLAAGVLTPDLVDLLPHDSDAGAWGALLLAREGRTSRSVRDPDRKEVSERSVSSPLTR